MAGDCQVMLPFAGVSGKRVEEVGVIRRLVDSLRDHRHQSHIDHILGTGMFLGRYPILPFRIELYANGSIRYYFNRLIAVVVDGFKTFG